MTTLTKDPTARPKIPATTAQRAWGIIRSTLPFAQWGHRRLLQPRMLMEDGGAEPLILALTRKALIRAGSVLQVDVVVAGQMNTVRKTTGSASPPAESSGISITGPA
jgi:hypothetical protein